MSRRGEARAEVRGRPARSPAAAVIPVVRWIDNGVLFGKGSLDLELKADASMDPELREELERRIREVIEEHGCRIEEVSPL